jgi:formamidopyrimidine-DNA glycosylase
MPELPEVETLKRELAKSIINKTIKSVAVTNTKTVALLSVKNFSQKTVGRKIINIDRRAKIIVITLDDTHHLIVHLKMTGQLIYRPVSGKLISGGHSNPPAGGLPNKFTRIIFTFTDGATLFFNDMRKFGWIKHLQNHERENLFLHTGIEPLSKKFTDETFKKLLAKYPKQNLKKFLLNQTHIAGLGNIYVDEACFLSKVLPTRPIGSLSATEKKALHKNIIAVLKLSISKKGTSAKNYVRSDGRKGGFVPYLFVYGRAGLPCKKCHTPISKIRHAGRGTHFCPKCQK